MINNAITNLIIYIFASVEFGRLRVRRDYLRAPRYAYKMHDVYPDDIHTSWTHIVAFWLKP